MPVSVHLNSNRINREKLNLIKNYCKHFPPTICVCNLNGGPLEFNEKDCNLTNLEISSLIAPGYYENPDELLLEKIKNSNYYNYNLKKEEKIIKKK